MSHHHHHHNVDYCDDSYRRPCYDDAPLPYAREESYISADRFGSPPNIPDLYERRTAEPTGRQQPPNFQRNERLGELGALAAGAFALYEANRAKTDVEHADKHKKEAELAGVAALGSGGYAVYEHHQKKRNEW